MRSLIKLCCVRNVFLCLLALGFSRLEANQSPVADGSYQRQLAIEGKLYRYAFTEGAFVDPDGDTLVYSAQLAGSGGALPQWLSFNATAGELSGVPEAQDVGFLLLEVSAEDPSGALASKLVELRIREARPAVGDALWVWERATAGIIFNDPDDEKLNALIDFCFTNGIATVFMSVQFYSEADKDPTMLLEDYYPRWKAVIQRLHQHGIRVEALTGKTEWLMPQGGFMHSYALPGAPSFLDLLNLEDRPYGMQMLADVFNYQDFALQEGGALAAFDALHLDVEIHTLVYERSDTGAEANYIYNLPSGESVEVDEVERIHLYLSLIEDITLLRDGRGYSSTTFPVNWDISAVYDNGDVGGFNYTYDGETKPAWQHILGRLEEITFLSYADRARYLADQIGPELEYVNAVGVPFRMSLEFQDRFEDNMLDNVSLAQEDALSYINMRQAAMMLAIQNDHFGGLAIHTYDNRNEVDGQYPTWLEANFTGSFLDDPVAMSVANEVVIPTDGTTLINPVYVKVYFKGSLELPYAPNASPAWDAHDGMLSFLPIGKGYAARSDVENHASLFNGLMPQFWWYYSDGSGRSATNRWWPNAPYGAFPDVQYKGVCWANPATSSVPDVGVARYITLEQGEGYQFIFMHNEWTGIVNANSMRLVADYGVNGEGNSLANPLEIRMYLDTVDNYANNTAAHLHHSMVIADSDRDGLEDYEEQANFTDPNKADTDEDGLSDGDEWILGTSPNWPDSDGDGLNDAAEINASTDPLDADSDNDEMPDGWEVENNLDPTLNDASGDADGDEVSNLDEYLAGTNPQYSDTDNDGGASDSDGDGIVDSWELAHGTLPNEASSFPVTWYVSVDAVGQEDGSAGAPFNTIGEALDTIATIPSEVRAQTRFTITIGEGTYAEKLMVNLPNITLQSLNDEHVVIVGDGSGAPGIETVWSARDLVVEGLTVSVPNGTGLLLSSCARVTLRGCHVDENGGIGVDARGLTNPTIEDCTIRGNASYGIRFINGTNKGILIKGSSIVDNSNHGISFGNATEDISLINNEISGNANSGIAAGGAGSGFVIAVLKYNNLDGNNASGNSFPAMQLPPSAALQSNAIYGNYVGTHYMGMIVSGLDYSTLDTVFTGPFSASRNPMGMIDDGSVADPIVIKTRVVAAGSSVATIQSELEAVKAAYVPGTYHNVLFEPGIYEGSGAWVTLLRIRNVVLGSTNRSGYDTSFNNLGFHFYREGQGEWSTGVEVHRLGFTNVTGPENGGRPLYFNGGDGHIVKGCYFNKCTAYGLALANAGTFVEGNEIYNAPMGLWLVNGSHHAEVRNNRIRYCNAGMLMNNGPRDNLIIGNDLSFNDVGLKLVTGSYQVRHNRIVGNEIAHNRKYGVLVVSSNPALPTAFDDLSYDAQDWEGLAVPSDYVSVGFYTHKAPKESLFSEDGVSIFAFNNVYDNASAEVCLQEGVTYPNAHLNYYGNVAKAVLSGADSQGNLGEAQSLQYALSAPVERKKALSEQYLSLSRQLTVGVGYPDVDAAVSAIDAGRASNGGSGDYHAELPVRDYLINLDLEDYIATETFNVNAGAQVRALVGRWAYPDEGIIEYEVSAGENLNDVLEAPLLGNEHYRVVKVHTGAVVNRSLSLGQPTALIGVDAAPFEIDGSAFDATTAYHYGTDGTPYMTRAAIVSRGVHSVYLNHLKIKNLRDSSGGYVRGAVLLNSGSGHVVKGVEFENVEKGVWMDYYRTIDGVIGLAPRDVRIEENNFHSGSAYSVVANSGTHHVDIVGNTFENVTTGVWSVNGSQNIVLSGNTFEGVPAGREAVGGGIYIQN